MPKLQDSVSLIFNPLTILGIPRVYQVLDRVIQPPPNVEVLTIASDPSFHVPLVCSVASIACSVLSHDANRHLVAKVPNLSSRSPLALLTYCTAGAIILMYLFAVDRDRLALWFGSYALLLIINAPWNYLAVAPQHRWVHVLTNALFGVALVVLATLARDLLDSVWAVYSVLVVIWVVKLWQRSQPRW